MKNYIKPSDIINIHQYRKKDAEKIERELLEAVSPTFLKHICEDINFWLTDSCRILLCMEIIKSGKGKHQLFKFRLVFQELLCNFSPLPY